jgi:hypothetical protein
VLLIGRDLATTVAGTLLAQRGLRVMAVAAPGDPTPPTRAAGQPPAPADRYGVGPYVLPLAPMPLVGAEAPGIRKIVADLNLVQLFRRRIEPNRPSYQLLYPDARIDVDDELHHALEREVPGALPAWEKLAATLDETSGALESILAEEVMIPPDGFWDRRDGKRVASRLPDPGADPIATATTGLDARAASVLRALVTLPARFHGDVADPSVVTLARAADLWRRGSFRMDGGYEGLRTLFLDRLRALGGEHRPELRASAIQIRRGRIVAVDVGPPEGEIGCEQAIVGVSAEALLPLFEGERPPRRLVEAAAHRPALFRYLLHLVVPLDVLPDALSRVAFSVLDPDGPLSGHNALRLHLQDGYGQHAVLSAEALTPDPSPAALAELRAGIRRHLTTLLPFVDRHLLCVHSPHDGLPPEKIDESAMHEPLPAPRPLDPLWTAEEPRLLGVCGLPYDSGLKGLWLAGRQSLPGLGLEGELEAGLRVARLVVGAAKKRDATGATLR